MVGVYLTFLMLDKDAFRRSENISIISIFHKQASLVEVLRSISGQLSELPLGVPVLDFANAKPPNESKATDYTDLVMDCHPLRVPFKTIMPRVAYCLGDAVSQAVLAGARSVNATHFCRCCFVNQASTKLKSNVYDVDKCMLRWDFGTYLVFFLCVCCMSFCLIF